MRFEFLEHTADIKLKIYGASKKELFENACYAMASIQRENIGDLEKETPEVLRTVKVEASDLDLLLVEFLQEIVYLTDTNNEVYPTLNIKKLSDNKLEGKLQGFSVDKFSEDIKAVTYNDLEVKKTVAGWEAIVVFDI